MLEKKQRQKEAREEEEKRNLINQEVIKQRLNELDKLRKQIAEADFTTAQKGCIKFPTT